MQEGAIRIFDDVIPGKTFGRPGLSALLDHGRPGDTLAVIRRDRLKRSLKELNGAGWHQTSAKIIRHRNRGLLPDTDTDRFDLIRPNAPLIAPPKFPDHKPCP